MSFKSKISFGVSTSMLVAALGAAGAGAASAAVPEAAFHANNSGLWTAFPTANLGDAMATSASPSSAQYGTGSYVIAYTDSAGNLATGGTAGQHSWGTPVAAGTDPSVARTPTGFMVAFASPAGPTDTTKGTVLWTASLNGSTYTLKDTGVGLGASANPSIAYGDGVDVIAYQTASGDLGFFDTAGDNLTTAVPLSTGTSPSVAAAGPYFEVAFNSGGTLGEDWMIPSVPSSPGMPGSEAQVGPSTSLGESTAANRSPSLAIEVVNNHLDQKVAYVSSTGILHVRGGSADQNLGYPVAAASSPSIAFTDATGNYRIGYSSAVTAPKPGAAGQLLALYSTCTVSKSNPSCMTPTTNTVTNLGVDADTSPALTLP